MTIEALWTVHFSANGRAANAIIVFKANQLFGGDNQFYYTGTYSLNGRKIVAKLRARNYGGAPQTSLFGNQADQEFEVEASIPTEINVGTVMSGTGKLLSSAPLPSFSFTLTCRVPLP